MPQISRDLTDAQWAILDSSIPEPTPRKDGRGRPWKERRAVLNGVLWVLRTGAPWSNLPERYPSYQTCHRRFQQWVRSGIMRGVLEALAEERKTCKFEVGWMFVNPSSTAALLQPKRGPKVGKTKRGKGTKIMAVADSHGLPVAVCIESATPHEVKLATSTLVQTIVSEAPQNLIGDTPTIQIICVQNSGNTELN